MRLIVKEHRLGMPGLKDGLAQVGELIAEGMRDPKIFAWARRAMWKAALGVAATPTQIASAIYAELRRDMVFAQDPYCTELMMRARYLLCLDPDGPCIRGGDCDDNVIVLGAALMSVGIPVKLLVRSYPEMGQLHLMLLYDADIMKRDSWTCFDATSPDGACFGGYDGQLVADLEAGPMIVDRQSPQFLVLGLPPLFGAPPAASAPTLTPEQQAAWAAILGQEKAKLDASVAGLVDSTTRLDAVRASLGLPAADSPSTSDVAAVAGGAAAGGSSPIELYAHDHLWTVEAQKAQSKLVQTAQFASGVLAGALSGARGLYWNAGDLEIGTLDGDAYGVLLKKDASGALVLSYVDLTSDQKATGQVGFGIAPIVIAVGVVALSIAAAVAVYKICDYLASAHRDDAMGKVASEQQALVAAGKETPEQAKQFVSAATDLVAAPPGGKAGMDLTMALAIGAVGLAVGLVGGVVVPRLIPRVSFGGAPAPA